MIYVTHGIWSLDDRGKPYLHESRDFHLPGLHFYGEWPLIRGAKYFGHLPKDILEFLPAFGPWEPGKIMSIDESLLTALVHPRKAGKRPNSRSKPKVGILSPPTLQKRPVRARGDGWEII